MRRALILPLVLAIPSAAAANDPAPPRPLQPVPFTRVKFADTFWTPRLETNLRTTVAHNLKMCEDTGRLANFAKAAKLQEGTHQGIYFDDSDVYKVLEGVAYSLQHRRDPDVEARLDAIIDTLAKAQQPDGYLNTYYTLKEPGNRWTNLPVMHELYCAGHLVEAAVAHHQATGKRTLLDVATRFADHIDSIFGPDKRHGVPGHEELELALVKLGRLTGEKRYLDLAAFFVDERGRPCGRNSYGEYCQDHLPVREQSDIVGHAVRAMYLYSAVADVAALSGDRALVGAMGRVWRNVVHKKMYVTGGVGHASYSEGFSGDYDLPNDAAYAETCASIGMMLWNHRLLLLHADGRYGDVFERVLYNGFLAGVSMKGDTFFYVNPLASRGQHHRQPWYSCACCPTNVVRIMPSLPGYIYGVRPDEGIWVNLYVAGAATLTLDAGEVALAQETRYPWDGRIRVRVERAPEAPFAIALRVPAWSEGTPGRSASINGEALDLSKLEKGFIVARRAWKAGDAVELDCPMEIRRVEAHPDVAEDRGRVALQRGPLVYCLEGADHPGVSVRSLALSRDAKLEAERVPALLGGVTVLRGAAQAPDAAGWEGGLYRPARAPASVPLTAIPYYAWDHRAAGEMVVWIPETLGLAEIPPVPPRAAAATASYSHLWKKDTTAAALNDGLVPKNSADHSIPRFSWYGHKGTEEWVAYEFPESMNFARAEVYWTDDGKGTRTPESWRLLYRDGDAWKPVEGASACGVEKDRFNVTRFKPVTSKALRLEAKLRPDAAAGILEWRLPE